MKDCFFCGSTENPLTDEHVWPKWVSKLLKGQYGSDHFVHVRSASDSTTGLWKSPDLKVTTDQICIRCNNEWLSVLENDHVKPIATPLILDQGGDIIKPSDQWILATWAYKMALLLEIAMPKQEQRITSTPAERKQFCEMKVANEHVRVFIAKYKYGQHPTHAHQKLHTLTRHDDGMKFDLKIATLTAGCLAMQVIAVRSVDTGELVYATSELEIELLGEAKTKIAQIWPLTNNAVRWSDLAPMSQQDIEDWTDMWERAQGLHSSGSDHGMASSP